MFRYFTPIFTEFTTLMAIYPRNLVSLIHGIQTYARPFDEILYSLESGTSTNDTSCQGVQSSSDSLKWTNQLQWLVWFLAKHDSALDTILQCHA